MEPMECRECGARAKQVVFGMPSHPLTPEEEERYILGGCEVDHVFGPVYGCIRCNRQWTIRPNRVPQPPAGPN
jgi:hypothetical protein